MAKNRLKKFVDGFLGLDRTLEQIKDHGHLSFYSCRAQKAL